MMPRMIDTSGEIWLYRPDTNKNTWRGVKYKRVVALCKTAQSILLPLLAGTGQHEYIFRPENSMREAGLNGVAGKKYNKDAYCRAVARACARAFPDEDIKWTPYQLRHTAATYIRKMLGDKGVSASQVYLGQKSLDVAEIYAKADQGLIEEAVKVMDTMQINRGRMSNEERFEQLEQSIIEAVNSETGTNFFEEVLATLSDDACKQSQQSA